MQVNDVCIAGGGPAGLAASLALRSRGFQVTVVDCAIPPIDKACGEGLMPDGIAALKRLGVDIEPKGGYAFRGILFSDGHSTVKADFPVGSGVGLRRRILHQHLITHAEAAGVRLIWGAKNVRLCKEGVATQDGVVRAQFVVGADGQQSGIRSSAGLNAFRSETRRYGFRTHYRLAPWSEYVELYWGQRGQIYVTPIAADEVCVAFISRSSKLRLEEALADFPELKKRLSSVEHGSHEMGAMSVSRRLKRVYKDGLALLGDASGSVDAITGEGMCLAFKQAEALAEALRDGDLRHYAFRHNEISAKPQMMASVMLTLEGNSSLQRRALAGLAKQPRLFETLLKFHVGEASLRDLLSTRWLGFGMGALSA